MILQDVNGKFVRISREDYLSSVSYYMAIGYTILNKRHFQNLAK